MIISLLSTVVSLLKQYEGCCDFPLNLSGILKTPVVEERNRELKNQCSYKGHETK